MSALGTILVVSGPSGSGKTTLCRRSTDEGLSRYSISCTTRAPRPGEQDGVDYHFLTMEAFHAKVAAGEFLEYATVHGNCYGTLKSDILDIVRRGETVVMDIDVQGAEQVRGCDDPLIRRCYADVYIHIPADELEQRLRGRATDAEDVIQLRLRNAAEEDRQMGNYGFVLVSGDREADYSRFKSLLSALAMRTCLR